MVLDAIGRTLYELRHQITHLPHKFVIFISREQQNAARLAERTEFLPFTILAQRSLKHTHVHDVCFLLITRRARIISRWEVAINSVGQIMGCNVDAKFDPFCCGWNILYTNLCSLTQRWICTRRLLNCSLLHLNIFKVVKWPWEFNQYQRPLSL